MGITPSMLFGTVMHKRLLPKINAFQYGIYYMAFPLSKIDTLPMARNRFSLLSFYDRDHGERNGRSLEKWARNILSEYQITDADGEIVLVCMPRVLGYVFNPVSFWLCYDKNQNIRAILCEVRNTFGERHTYLCAHDDGRPIEGNETLTGQKVFHVSPFLKREGHYTFRFDIQETKMGVWIDFYNDDGNKQLITSLIGTLKNMTSSTLNYAFWRYPLVTLKAIFLIHWQALKLVAKGIKYIPKPQQEKDKISATSSLTKM